MSAATERAAQALLDAIDAVQFPITEHMTLDEARKVIGGLEDAGVLILSESGRRT